ncbi:MAG: hypothetical protein JJU42_06180 [Rhodobacteraceae bacterium]|nr:hypothetical protein [Paracoccaceae bacterium]
MRKKIIESAEILHLRPDDVGYPRYLRVEDKEPCEVWMLNVTYRVGLRPIQFASTLFYREQDAKQALEENKPGLEVSIGGNYSEEEVEIIREILDSKFKYADIEYDLTGAGDGESPLAVEILSRSGIYKKDYSTLTPDVLNYLGDERVRQLKNKLGSNWSIVAAFEYCYVKLPSTSLAYIAAAYQYFHHVLHNHFAAGYFWRDLEVLALGVEGEATKAIEMRQKAGGAGGKTSRNSREKRRSDLLDKIEALAAQNPAIVQFSEEAVAKVVLADCVRDNPNLWKQGKGQVNNYLGEIRRGEAGDDMKARFQTLFGSKPPKRLG